MRRNTITILLAAAAISHAGGTVVLGLDGMFDLATKNNRQLRLGAAGVEVGAQAVEVARTPFLPRIGVSASASYLGDAMIVERDFSDARTASTPHFGNSFSIEASQTVYAGGALSGALSQAKLEERAARLDLQREVQDVRLQLAGLYLDLWAARNQRQVYAKAIVREELVLEQVRARFQAGAALRSEVVRHELALQELRLGALRLDNRADILNDRLGTLLGLPESTLVVPDTLQLANAGRELSTTELGTLSAEELPELRAAETRVHAAEAGVKTAKAARMPTVALFAGDRLEGPIVVEVPPIDRNLQTWYVGAGVRYDLASIHTAGRTVRLAERKVDVATMARNLAKERASLALRAAVVAYREAFEELRVREKACEFARENHDVVRERYASGAALVTEMLDASDALLGAELELANARLATLFRQASLGRAAGTL